VRKLVAAAPVIDQALLDAPGYGAVNRRDMHGIDVYGVCADSFIGQRVRPALSTFPAPLSRGHPTLVLPLIPPFPSSAASVRVRSAARVPAYARAPAGVVHTPTLGQAAGRVGSKDLLDSPNRLPDQVAPITRSGWRRAQRAWEDHSGAPVCTRNQNDHRARYARPGVATASLAVWAAIVSLWS
jgi:hypothetical protein